MFCILKSPSVTSGKHNQAEPDLATDILLQVNNTMALERDIIIKNPYGFHIRPIQRFTQLAKAFASDIEVTIGGKHVPGKSIVHLMTLQGKCGSEMRIRIIGPDESQAMAILGYLSENQFFVEDELNSEDYPTRHMKRLVEFARAFKSEITVSYGGDSCNAKELTSVLALGFEPWEKPDLSACGEDAQQALSIMNTLLKYNFFVEEDFEDKKSALASKPGE